MKALWRLSTSILSQNMALFPAAFPIFLSWRNFQNCLRSCVFVNTSVRPSVFSAGALPKRSQKLCANCASWTFFLLFTGLLMTAVSFNLARVTWTRPQKSFEVSDGAKKWGNFGRKREGVEGEGEKEAEEIVWGGEEGVGDVEKQYERISTFCGNF